MVSYSVCHKKLSFLFFEKDEWVFTFSLKLKTLKDSEAFLGPWFSWPFGSHSLRNSPLAPFSGVTKLKSNHCSFLLPFQPGGSIQIMNDQVQSRFFFFLEKENSGKLIHPYLWVVHSKCLLNIACKFANWPKRFTRAGYPRQLWQRKDHVSLVFLYVKT